MTEKKIHMLKIVPPYFDLIIARRKLWEYRLNDRDFKEGDFLHLKEWDPFKKDYSGRFMEVLVTYIAIGGRFGIPEGYCIMSIRPTGFGIELKNLA